MQKVKDIIQWLDGISPFETQESWDNCGLNVGNEELIVEHIYIALEATLEIIEQMEENSLLITHHPLIFRPLKNMIENKYPVNIIKRIMQKNIALIALHTNFDKSHFSYLLAKRILGFEHVRKDGYIAFFDIALSHDDLVKKIKTCFNIEYLFCNYPQKYYHTGALISGAGTSMVAQLNVDCLLSGDMRYHDAMIATSLRRTIFDIRHYESEKFFGLFMQEILQKEGIKASILDFKNPFILC